jgi:hypothetical protein
MKRGRHRSNSGGPCTVAPVLILRFPLDQRRHGIVRRRLDRLAIARDTPLKSTERRQSSR